MCNVNKLPPQHFKTVSRGKMTEALVDNYLGITREDLDSLNPEDLQLSASAENVLKEFRGLECTVCAHHFGFQNRWDPKILLCSPRCLSVANNKVKNLPPGQHPFSRHLALTGSIGGCRGAVTPKQEMNADVPRPAQQGLGNQNQVNIQMPRINNGQKDQRYSSSSERDNDRGNERESSYGSDRSGGRVYNGTSNNAGRGGRGGYNNTTNRGGRVGGNQQRTSTFGNGKTDRADESPFIGNGEKQDWGGRAADETDSRMEVEPAATKTMSQERPVERTAVGKENTDPTTKSLQMNNKETMLNAARQARIVRPASKPSEAPAPAAAVVTTTAPTITATPLPRKEVTVTPVAVPKAVPAVSAPTPKSSLEKKQSEKKVWTEEDMTLSLSLVNMAACTISFKWSPTKLTLTAVADAEKLAKFHEDLNAYCQKAPPLTRVPSVGDIVFALYEGEYYRAKVDTVGSDGKEAYVIFIDFGDALTVKFSDCREPEDELMKSNLVYGVVFHISLKVACPENLDLCKELMDALELEQVIMEIEKQSRTEFTGKLYLDEKRTWNEILEKQILASNPAAAKASGNSAPAPTKSVPIVQPPQAVKPVPAPTPPAAAPVTAPPVAATPPSVQEKATAVTKEVTRPKPSNPFGATKPSPLRRNIHTVQWSPSLVAGAKVHVNFMWKYNKMTVSAQDDDAGVEKLGALIADHAAKAPPMQRIPAVDEVVIGPYDGAYYRGRVTAVDKDMVDVEFLDYGDSIKVKASDLKELSNEINNHPIYGIVMTLSDVPDDIPASDFLSAEQPTSGQIEVLNQGNGTMSGRLWISEDSSWNDFILDHLASVGK